MLLIVYSFLFTSCVLAGTPVDDLRDEFYSKFKAIENELAETKHELAETKHEVSVLRNKHEHDTDRAARQIVYSPSQVAFHAYLSAHPTGLAHHDVIPFDMTKLNAGNAFDPSTHVFTCPFNGIYVFQSALMSEAHDMVQTEIVIDGADEVSMYAAGSTNSHGFDQGFNALVNTCRKGQRVWVRNYHINGHGMYSMEYSSFSGFLLYEVEMV
ncbi:complement C1q-like protein 2 [Mya arenaria]|uniref:complement C1q-like protein 2 n=1 Tax=Mya arenaria TaxID=6604 RepID=UPI0022DFD5D5|nr:complement C1q-like protein 2 [Mya arenaria]